MLHRGPLCQSVVIGRDFQHVLLGDRIIHGVGDGPRLLG